MPDAMTDEPLATRLQSSETGPTLMASVLWPLRSPSDSAATTPHQSHGLEEHGGERGGLPIAELAPPLKPDANLI